MFVLSADRAPRATTSPTIIAVDMSTVPALGDGGYSVVDNAVDHAGTFFRGVNFPTRFSVT